MGGAVEVLGTGDYPLLKLCVENNSGRDLLIRNTDKTYVNGEKPNGITVRSAWRFRTDVQELLPSKFVTEWKILISMSSGSAWKQWIFPITARSERQHPSN